MEILLVLASAIPAFGAAAFIALLCNILTPFGWLLFIALACIPQAAGLISSGGRI